MSPQEGFSRMWACRCGHANPYRANSCQSCRGDYRTGYRTVYKCYHCGRILESGHSCRSCGNTGRAV